MKRIIAKMILSAVVLLIFGAICVLVARTRPFHAPRDVNRLRRTLADSSTSEGTDSASLPVPPYTELTLSNDTPRGQYYRYETQLSMEGIREFYTSELPPRGWERDPSMGFAMGQAGLQRPVLSFQNGRIRCVISVEEGGAFTNVVTVLVVGDMGQRSELGLNEVLWSAVSSPAVRAGSLLSISLCRS
jgi:hypothetical protein